MAVDLQYVGLISPRFSACLDDQFQFAWLALADEAVAGFGFAGFLFGAYGRDGHAIAGKQDVRILAYFAEFGVAAVIPDGFPKVAGIFGDRGDALAVLDDVLTLADGGGGFVRRFFGGGNEEAVAGAYSVLGADALSEIARSG